ncbi:hypothetical protein VTK73DRAFT_6689 [Phialemonium thermophilum]|uniref:Uncharacterized protein n=1 Tax=Phialemonium thermophilum TaxID=223376 RepID=A0ABR3WIA2_9PEZI
MKRLKAFSRNRSTSSKYKENHAIDPDLEEFQWAGKKVNWKENIHPRDRKKIESPVARRKQGDRVKPHFPALQQTGSRMIQSGSPVHPP